MTVSMDHNKNNKRRESWDSKVSSYSAGARRLRRGTGSALSSDSDIRFTRRKLGERKRCGCLLVASFLGALLLGSVAVYLAYTYLIPEPPELQEFRARFRVLHGDSFSSQLADVSSPSYERRARDYRDMINLVFRRSELRPGFTGTEVLALDGEEDKDLVVHFSLQFDPVYQRVSTDDVERVLSREIARTEPRYLIGLSIDPVSLEVRESCDLPSSTAPLANVPEPPVTPASRPQRRCARMEVSYCTGLSYNITAYPNLLGHKNLADIQSDMIAFRELVDAECYRAAIHFVCRLLQPECLPAPSDIEGYSSEPGVRMPCRSFCREFWAGCGSRLPEKLRTMLDCNGFPEYSGPGSCAVKPGCSDDLEAKALSPRLCDGVPDCADLGDELRCSYCSSGGLHCGRGRACIASERLCDGRPDCPDGADEKSCLGISPSLHSTMNTPLLTPHLPTFRPEGYVVFMERGRSGKLCAEGLEAESLPQTFSEAPVKKRSALDAVATSLCRALTYRSVEAATIVPDAEVNVSYVRVEDPAASEFSFVRSACSSRQVVHVSCKDLECGLQSALTPGAALGKLSGPGDWPWHAALFRDGAHVCDATLVAPEWLLTTAACFQGQSRAEWRARLGASRLDSEGPWQQERRVVGMVKSPVEGSTAALVRLESPASLSDFVRPVCLTDGPETYLARATHCNALGWARHRKQLQRVQLRVSDMQRCENVSIATVNSLCTEAAFPQQDCNEEELAGSPMLCLQADGKRWSLVGVSTWRIACAGTGATRGTERPRMYDKISSNVAWVRETIAADREDKPGNQ